MEIKYKYKFSGIYQIKNKINGNFYIGSSKNIYNRKSCHLAQLRENRHHSKYLQRSYNKYGGENFEFTILLVCENFELLRYEQFFLDNYHPKYNSYPIAGSPFGITGRHHSEETKRKIGEGNKGKVISEYARKCVAEANKKRVISEETRNKMRLSKLGSKNTFWGKKPTEEVLRKKAENRLKKKEQSSV
jgi:group I intron endonuclease